MRDSTTYVPVHAGIWGHRKVRRMRRTLNVSLVEAVGHLVSLWTAAIGQAGDDGALDGWDHEDIADAARWEGDPDVLLSALVECGFVSNEHDYKHFSLHDWDLYGGKSVALKRKARERMKAHRAKQKSERDADVRERSRTDENGADTFADVRCEGEGEGKEESSLLPTSEERETRADARPLPQEDDPGHSGFGNRWGMQPADGSDSWSPPGKDATVAWFTWLSAYADTRAKAWPKLAAVTRQDARRQLAAECCRLGDEVGWDVFVEACQTHIDSGRALGAKLPSKSFGYLRGIAEGIVGDRASGVKKKTRGRRDPLDQSHFIERSKRD